MLNAMLIIASATLVTGCSGTQIPSHAGAVPDEQLRCHDATYEGFSFWAETPIPDGDAAGTRIGPVHIADDGNSIGDIMVGIDMSHGYVGDIEIRLVYDEDGDGRAEVSSVLEVFQARLDACDEEALYAYPVVLDGRYFFRGDVSGRSTDDGSPLESFTDLKRGGDFYLAVSDNAAGNTGTVHGWTLFLDGDDRAGLVNVVIR